MAHAGTHVPGYFALLMGTGIITIGAGQRGWHTLAELLLILTALEYAVLVLHSLWRVGAYTDLVVVDVRNPRASFRFFTFVAGTNVLAAAPVQGHAAGAEGDHRVEVADQQFHGTHARIGGQQTVGGAFDEAARIGVLNEDGHDTSCTSDDRDF